MAATVTMLADLRFVEPGGKLPLEVGAVLPQPREVVGGQTGHGDGVVHQPVLVRQDLSEKNLFSRSLPFILVPQFNSIFTHLSL